MLEPASLLAASLPREQSALRTGRDAPRLSPGSRVAGRGARRQPGRVRAAALAVRLDGGQARMDALGDGRTATARPADRGGYRRVAGGHRALRCFFPFCAWRWELTYACIYCGESGGSFVTAAPDEETGKTAASRSAAAAAT